MSIKKEILHYDQNNLPIYRFRIPNQTGDYVELTNLGCKICGIHVHKLDGIMENITAALSEDDSIFPGLTSGSLIGGMLGESLSDKVWSIADEGENSVFLTYECFSKGNKYNVDLQLGVNVTWVNLNRLIVDFFLTPREKICINFSSNLNINSDCREFVLRSFCPVVKRSSGDFYEVKETEYQDMTFVPVKDVTDIFMNPNDEIKPMIELSDRKSKLRISAYSTLTSISVHTSQCNANKDILSIICAGKRAIELNAGETLANRVIFGFDYIEDIIPDDAEPNPFSFFL